MLEKFDLFEFENLLQQDKDTYILYLLTIPEQDRTSIDKHILKFNTIKVKPENILVEN
jgi:parvulin-like peptidyl-prolyl isomerase